LADKTDFFLSKHKRRALYWKQYKWRWLIRWKTKATPS